MSPYTHLPVPCGFAKALEKKASGAQRAVIANVVANSGILASLLTGAVATHSMQQAPKASKRDAYQILRKSTLPHDYPRGTMPGFGNAAYVPSPDAEFQNTVEWATMKTNPSDRDRFDKNVERDKGVLLFDPEYHSPGVVGHEIGHAEIDQKGGLSRINQRYLRGLGTMYGIGAIVAAARIRDASIRRRQAIAASAILGAIPTLINEAQASRRSKQLMDAAGYSRAEQEPQRKALRHAYLTYVAGGLAPSAALIAALEYLRRSY